VTQSSSFSFEFKVRNEALAQGIKEGALPFQVQIRYTRLDGSELVRVQTLEQKVTQNQQEAEAEVNLNVVAQNAVQSAAEYASSGNYGKARERMVMQQRLMQRTSPSPAYAPQSPMYAAAAPAPGMPQQQQQQQQQTYNAYVQQAVELDDLLQAQERAEAPNLDEEALNRSRVSSRSDTLSKAIYKAKSNRK
jgi:hypothetical protein